ncbi:hypothetical protein LC605_25030 [Nostoc sp. CHAB 5836]|uniref:hypothetical protein n=1 Tax=Nostoc sp. CHAB 5836 TaxID=2780404 RepID=UPI001E6387D0|nr:hypothetical protein [Nostoc sp. CHAB 5836]MCC5618289.1 hypothetical protein [Nostoc sp. CHAB 5836]
MTCARWTFQQNTQTLENQRSISISGETVSWEQSVGAARRRHRAETKAASQKFPMAKTLIIA